nr:MAG TPA: hypothetical protein [Caudoviricetes sp.]
MSLPRKENQSEIILEGFKHYVYFSDFRIQI